MQNWYPSIFSQDTSLLVNNVDSNIYINDPLKDSILLNYSNKLKKRIIGAIHIHSK